MFSWRDKASAFCCRIGQFDLMDVNQLAKVILETGAGVPKAGRGFVVVPKWCHVGRDERPVLSIVYTATRE
jgi:hypothetical protein